MSESRETLKEEFKANKEYREAYAEDFLNTWVATQIKVLREQRGMTQQELAEKIGTQQAGVSRLENVNYSAWKTETLRKIARALGARLKITFETYGSLLDEADHFSRESLQCPDFDHDPAFAPAPEIAAVAVLNSWAVSSIIDEGWLTTYNGMAVPVGTTSLLVGSSGTTASYNWLARRPVTTLPGAIEAEPPQKVISSEYLPEPIQAA